MYDQFIIRIHCTKWKLLIAAFVVSSWLSLVTGSPKNSERNTECYKPYGCFSTRYPFNQVLMTLPEPPSKIGSFYILHTRETVFTFRNLKDNTLKNVARKIGNRKLKIIVHGLLESTSQEWMHKLTEEFLKEDDYCVIQVDWRNGANNLFASGNARLMGAQVGYLIKKLKREHLKSLSMKDLQLLGFSLGAHVVGYAGKYIKKFRLKIGRITGLDPGDLPNGMIYENGHPYVRLDFQDADFVDIIHSDMAGLGLDAPIGHVDFYPNGGKLQPGCSVVSILKKLTKKDFIYSVGCNHFRATDYYIESINSDCKFPAYPCKNYQRYKRNQCRYCDGQCAIMGHKAVELVDKQKYRGRRLYLSTNSKSPFCLKEQRNSKKLRGWDNLFSSISGLDLGINEMFKFAGK